MLAVLGREWYRKRREWLSIPEVQRANNRYHNARVKYGPCDCYICTGEYKKHGVGYNYCDERTGVTGFRADDDAENLC